MKLKSVILCGVALTSLSAMAGTALTESRAFFATNPEGQVGKSATITIDGKFTDWSEDMIIARNGANNMATAYKGSHENNVLDIYAIFASWDDTNLYIGWQMCNTGDVWARPGDGPLTDYGKPGDIPLVLALSIDPSSQPMTGLLEDGRCIWCDNAGNGTTFDPASVHVDHIFYMSGKPGQGAPAMFTASNSKGDTNYGSACTLFSAAGITYQRGDGFLPSSLWRCRSTAEWATPTELISDPSIINDIYDAEKYDNIINNDVEGLKPHDTAYDTFYEICIPLKALGINRQWLEANGIGARVIGTRGESALDCCPFDPSMIDNAFGEYGKDNSTTHEKDDLDIITYAMADIAKIRDLENIDPVPNPNPNPDPNPNPNPDPNPNPGNGNYTVYLETGIFEAPYVYIWDQGNGDKQYAGAWPGTKMTLTTIDGTSYWKYSFNSEADLVNPMVIFNNGNPGNGNQTADLTLENRGLHNNSGFTGKYLDESTAVAAIEEAKTETATYFNLLGQPLPAAPESGIYIRIVNGKAQKIVR